MSVYTVTRLTADLEHVVGLLDRFNADPGSVFDEYGVTAPERDAITARDAHALLALGINPVPLRNLMFLLGVRGPQMWSTS